MWPDNRIRLQHMLDAAEQARAFILNSRRADLDNDQQLVRALVKAIEIIGEAAYQDRVKHRYLDEWVQAVNVHGRRSSKRCVQYGKILFKKMKRSSPRHGTAMLCERQRRKCGREMNALGIGKRRRMNCDDVPDDRPDYGFSLGGSRPGPAVLRAWITSQ